MGLEIKIKEKNHVYVVELRHSLDTETSPQLEDELKGIINENTRAIVLDMSGLEYISSAGIKLILSTEQVLKKKGATFAMIKLRPQIKRVFDSLKILSIFNVFDDMTEADRYIDQIIKEEIEKDKK